jgi:hypothetical protein
VPSPWEAAPAIDGPISRQEAPWLAAPPIDDQPAKPPITGTIEWNGKKAEVTVPGDATDDQIKAAGRAALVAKYPKVKFPEAKAIVLNDQRDHMSPERSLGDYVNLGLTGMRHGAGDLLDIVGKATGFPLPIGKLANTYGDAKLDEMGAPAASTDNERLGVAAAHGATMAVGASGPMSPGRTALMGASGATGGYASESTRQAGYGPGVQMLAGLAAGLAAPTAVSGGRAVLGGVASRSAVAPALPRAAA